MEKTKEVMDYELTFIQNYTGENAVFYSAIKKGEDKIKYIAKCLDQYKFKLLDKSLKHEIKYAHKYSLSNATTKFVESFKFLNCLYRIYEHYESINLEEYLQAEDLQTTGRKSEILLWMLKALDSLHDIGKAMHGNLTPSHILINFEKGEIKFCGNSSIFYFEKGYPTNLVSNPPYRPPEWRPNDNPTIYTEKSDIYSLGVIIYKLFTNKPIQSSLIITNEAINELDNIEIEIKELISQCLREDPIKRPCVKELLLFKCFNSIYIDPPLKTQFGIELTNSYLKKNQNQIRTVQSLDPYIPTGNIYGKGGYAKVVQVTKKDTLKTFALKYIAIDKIIYEKEKELIINEIELLKEMSKSNFIVRIEDYFYFDNQLCIVLEECNGGDLKKYIENLKKNNKALKMDEIKLISWNVAEGLYLLHQNNIVHRDIKPQNILLIKNDKNVIIDAKICDLGLAKKLKNGETIFSSICGTVEYMAPEIRKMGNQIGGEMTIIADSFSFGLFLIYLAFGDQPTVVKNDPTKKIPDIYIPLPEYAKAFPDLYELIMKCIEENPKKRIDFPEIINHPFLKKIEIQPFLNNSNISINKALRQHIGQYSLGYLDELNKLWFKIYKLEDNDPYLTEIKNSIDREIEFLVKCKNIPHIIKLKEFGIIDESNSIIEIFEFCDGYNLESLFIKRSKTDARTTFKVREIKLVAKSLLEFVDHLHKKNYYHRSINPTHVLTSLDEKSGEIKDVFVCGFRTSKYANIKLENSFMYSEEELSYVDIDLFDRNCYSEDSDFWSIGMVIYFMALGKPCLKTKLQFENLRKNREIIFPSNIDKGIEMIINFCTRNCHTKSEFYSMTIPEFISKSNIF